MARKAVETAPVLQPERKLLCFLDRTGAAEIGGWAVDFDKPAESLKMRVMIDDAIEGVITCDLHRDDSRLVNLANSRIGFSYTIPERFWDGVRHRLRFAALDGALLPISSRAGGAVQEYSFVLEKPVRLMAVVDGMVDGLIQGWALRVDDHAGTKLGGVRVLVTHEGQPVAELLADQFRGDVAEAVGGDAACGFAFAPPPELRRRERVTLKFFCLPEREELNGSPLEISFPGDSAREKIEQLIRRTDELFSFAYHLKKELKAAIPRERFLLADYPRWALESRPLALARAKARYGVADVSGVLVSVICPVYRPGVGDFLAAVDSVRAQTHENWELLLIDDAGGDATLAAVMADLAALDPRIKFLPRKENGGIARATNDGLKAARGDFVAFFDHDDVLEPGALEIMLLAQAAHGAKLLYSDEDKVERGGAFSEPHFKPDFNHRLLLDINYICHLVMVEAGVLRAAGGLDPALDGAQDHDLLLRLSERLAPGQIHHVPEILYHWRKTARSTAAAGTGAKPKAGLAGARAVAAHLERLGLPAKVEPRGSLTCYKVDWKFPAARVKKAGVSILIPYRDHVEMTLECVEAIRAHTKGVNYEIILLDNWSTTPEAAHFAARQANIEGTRVLRIAEPFNYSRINNLGVREARHEFLLFMNNDVFVNDPGWLRRMLDEALADADVGGVGAKLLYADGTVQHAGVVLGVGGVADHAFRGLGGEAPGYMAQAIAAREVSAVTAACMLVRKSAFAAVGGFDERELSVAFNDVDLCVKLRQAGLKIIFMPDAVAEHRESVSRGDDFDHAKLARFMFENEVMRQRYEAVLPNDPYYNLNFSRDGGVYRELRLLRPGEA
ncbi:MAG TPA: glycosyltransferase family 2 protein [Acidocella sp.]|nr:glycosyltransferase family 2 protein [Acidocella sp.]